MSTERPTNGSIVGAVDLGARSRRASVRTTCPYCGVGCGVIATPDGKGGALIAGDPAHPANFGMLCSKGLTLGETLGLQTRVLHPMMRGRDGKLAATSWEAALDATAEGFRTTVERHGPNAVAFYLSGQLLTEDYYVANKLMKGFFGSANVDTNSRLCMASSVAGHRRAFGADVVPGCYEDLDQADLIIIVGSNAAWCHPILFQRMLRNKRERGARLVAVDVRATASTDEADLFLRIEPGMDTALFAGLLVHLSNTSAIDHAFLSSHAVGFDEALSNAQEIAPTVEATAEATGLSGEDVETFFGWFTATERTVTCTSQGVNQSAQGTDKVNAIINCHLATGRIGKPGMGPFSLTGQPNAMGGREVGGLANQLAAHMTFAPEERDRVARFWNAPRIAEHEGLKAVQMFEAVEAGKIKALWVMGTNPVASLPRGGAMARALAHLDLFVVSDNVISNDTINAGAHVLFPAEAWGEKEGTVTNSERRISRQRRVLPMIGEAKPDWWILSQVASRLGWAAAFPYQNAADIFAEHVALSAFENDGTRAFDLSGLGSGIAERYEDMEPFQWPATPFRRSERLFSDGRFFTSDGKARFAVVARPALAQATSAEFPLRLNTGRLRDQWHTMTRTGLSPSLGAHVSQPVAAVHPADAQRYGLEDGGFACLSTAHGSAIARVSVAAGQNRGSVFLPMHWSLEMSGATRMSDLVAPCCDAVSGQPEAKATPCAVRPVAFTVSGFAVSRSPIIFPGGLFTARVAIVDGLMTHIAANLDPASILDSVAAQMPSGVTFAEYDDPERGLRRIVGVLGGRVQFCLFLAASSADVPDPRPCALALRQEAVSSLDLIRLLNGVGEARSADATVCVCHGVRRSALISAIEDGCRDIAALGIRTKAGTNCGSCRTDLRGLLAVHP